MFDKKKQNDKLEIQYIALNVLKSWPKNPKKHDLELIGDSIREFGMRNPIVVNQSNGEVEAGHGRIEILSKMRDNGEEPPEHVYEKDGDWQVPVLFFNDNEIRQAKYTIVDNQSTMKAGWDYELLIEDLDYLKEYDNLDYTGFDEDGLKAIRIEYINEKEIKLPSDKVQDEQEINENIVITLEMTNDVYFKLKDKINEFSKHGVIINIA